MTLYKKDGSVYKLAGPNPMMQEQNLWNGFKTHNLQWKKDLAEDNTPKVVPPVEEDTFISALDKAKPEEIKVLEPEIERKPIVQPDLIEEETSSEIEKIFIHCLPMITKIRKDSLYGESSKTIGYGKPTSFEGVVLNYNDFVIEIWTDATIEVGSIIYPKMNFKRWWQIKEKTPKESGWIIKGVISNVQPSFD